jgi:hypothetical protein
MSTPFNLMNIFVLSWTTRLLHTRRTLCNLNSHRVTTSLVIPREHIDNSPENPQDGPGAPSTPVPDGLTAC